MFFRILLFLITLTILLPVAKACVTADWYFTLNLGNLKINQQKLESLCNSKSCYITEDFIVIRSSYDGRVAVIVGKTSSILGFKGITFRLPYVLNEEAIPTISEVDPKNYDWENLVKSDLNFLKDLGIVEVSSQDIEKISNLATNGKNVIFCDSEWQVLEPNCFCETDKKDILCVRCGAPTFDVKIPEKILNSKETSQKMELSRIMVLVFIAILLILIIYTSKLKKCCEGGEELTILK